MLDDSYENDCVLGYISGTGFVAWNLIKNYQLASKDSRVRSYVNGISGMLYLVTPVCGGEGRLDIILTAFYTGS